MEGDNSTPKKARNIKYQIVKVVVPQENAMVNINFNTDRLYKRITGILVSFPFHIWFLHKSTLSLQINDKEIFPDEFEAKLISYGLGIATNELFYQLDEEALGSTIKGKFKDAGEITAIVYPYTMNLYLRLEEKA